VRPVRPQPRRRWATAFSAPHLNPPPPATRRSHDAYCAFWARISGCRVCRVCAEYAPRWRINRSNPPFPPARKNRSGAGPASDSCQSCYRPRTGRGFSQSSRKAIGKILDQIGGADQGDQRGGSRWEGSDRGETHQDDGTTSGISPKTRGAGIDRNSRRLAAFAKCVLWRSPPVGLTAPAEIGYIAGVIEGR
jgi:hypothetical protein